MTETEGVAESIAKGERSWRDVAREQGAPEPATPEEIARLERARAEGRRRYYTGRERDEAPVTRAGRAMKAIGKLLKKPEAP